jgi:hypothetical protein
MLRQQKGCPQDRTYWPPVAVWRPAVANGPMRPKQLRRLHALWRRWGSRADLPKEAERHLRHYYIGLFTGFQCADTKALTEEQAARVIEWLARLVRGTEARQNYIAGTAGRQGFPERRQAVAGQGAWSALWGCAAALGMSRTDLDRFIRRHYSRVGLMGVAELHSMANLNRVLWGLKAMLRRRRARTRRFADPEKRAA